MIEFIFTIDYEIYGSGNGSLKDLVYEPTEQLKNIFDETDSKFVVFVEAAELEMIDLEKTDPNIDLVKAQVQALYREGHEIGLHMHPQWYNGKYATKRWYLDHSEYNLCELPPQRISNIVDRAISYLRGILGAPEFAAISFRAGNWLFKPTQPAAQILASRGIKIDSSVFKGGLRREHRLDYRQALKNGYYWDFAESADVKVQNGILKEMPIYSSMVPFWKLINSKRINLEQKGASRMSYIGKLYRILDFLRFWHPLKLDFCRMTYEELIGMMRSVLNEDRSEPEAFRPVIAIGHTKELVDFETITKFLKFINQSGIPVSTLKSAYLKCL